MDTSDDFLTGGGGVDIPKREAENVRRTAQPVDQVSDTALANRRRRRRQASFFARGFDGLQLGTPGLTGVSGGGVG